MSRKTSGCYGGDVGPVLLLAATAQAGEFRFSVGLTYASGPQEVMDKVKENYNVGSDFVLPVGIAFNPYYESDIGLGVGASLGPFTYMAVDAGNGTNTNMVIPIGADIRYTLFRKTNFSPYVRGASAIPSPLATISSQRASDFSAGSVRSSCAPKWFPWG